MRRAIKSKLLVMVIVSVLVAPVSVSAQTPSSTSYQVQESGFAAGSNIDANSASYNSRISIGDLGVGQSESGSYIGFGGFITPDQEYVELVIPVTVVNMGELNPGVPGTGTATFSARSYLNNDYIIVTLRDPPTSSGGAQIDPITTATAFDANTEQFGINLVANTSPASIGAAPSRQPVDDGTFAFGEAAPGYNTTNQYQYNAGDIIARSITRGYGETDYTISYLLNVTNTTPAGDYLMQQDLVMTATF